MDRTRATWDVVIVGGGPAGAATAVALRRHAPSLRVLIVDGAMPGRRRVGESLAPVARPLLAHLEALDLLTEPGAVESFGTAASWGGESLHANEFFLSRHGPGWQLDRERFDGGLLRHAAEAGAERCAKRVRGLRRQAGGWRLRLAGADEIAARFVVDATGRGAVIARRCGAAITERDPLVGVALYAGASGTCASGVRGTLVEATASGWWYGARLPGGGSVVSFMTDRDLVTRDRLQDVGRLRQVMRKSRHMDAEFGESLDRDVTVERPVVRATGPSRCTPAAGEDWLAVGDAASTYDPLAAQGVTKALQSGIFASYAIGDALCRGDSRGLTRFRRFVESGFDQHEKARQRYYDLESRWPDEPFWSRRRGSAS